MSELSRQLAVYTSIFSLFIFIFSSSAKADRPLENNQIRSPSSQIVPSTQNTIGHDSTLLEPPVVTTPPSRPIVPITDPKAKKNVSRSPSVLSSTVSGSIIKVTGNQFPPRGTRPSTAIDTPLMTKIYVFQGKIESAGDSSITYRSLNKKEFVIVKSDNSGRFKIELPPGEYTIFAETDPGNLYRNSFDGMGNFSTITIKDGENIVEDIKDTRTADF